MRLLSLLRLGSRSVESGSYLYAYHVTRLLCFPTARGTGSVRPAECLLSARSDLRRLRYCRELPNISTEYNLFSKTSVALRLISAWRLATLTAASYDGALDLGLAGNLRCLHHGVDTFAPWWDGVDGLLLGLDWLLPPLAASIFRSHPRCVALCRCDGTPVRFGELVGWIQHGSTEGDRERKEVGEEDGKIPKTRQVSWAR